MDGTASPWQSRFDAIAYALVDLSNEILPACQAVLAGDHELGITLIEWKVRVRQVRAGARDCFRVTGCSVSRELLCLFSKGLERRTSRERLHGSLLS
jgi:hypothetical protein